MTRLLTLLLFFLPCLLCGQMTVTGTVTDTEHRPLVDAYVYRPGTDFHTHTDARGMFRLPGLQTGDSLQVSHLGYAGKVIVVGSSTAPLDIELADGDLRLEDVIVRADIGALTAITKLDLATIPVTSSQELLMRVPGLIIGQHAGGGKAEQLFLRGFDIDHGTDVAVSVDGMPVNQVSHAHGQGYADLHFLIPETVQDIDFGKGPYTAHVGNFGTAGYVDFSTRDRLDNSTVRLEGGQFNTLRALGMFNLVDNQKQSAYLATDFRQTDGPYVTPQNFDRLNLFGKYTTVLPGGGSLSASLSHFTSEWDASGQIPQRALDQGIITRFGAIDATEGGTTDRTSVVATYRKPTDQRSFLRSTTYLSKYGFELFSNFTFFLEDPVNGDQIRQHEERLTFGNTTDWNYYTRLGDAEAVLRVGAGLRNDRVSDNQLQRTANRRDLLEEIQDGDVNETNTFGFVEGEITLGKLRINPALRFDHINFIYRDNLAANYSNESTSATAFSPKLNFTFRQSAALQFYLRTGIGYHSNDTRVILAGEAAQSLPSASGADLGFIWKPVPRLLVNTALWTLYSEQEFVYVGDAGVVEASGRSQRQGVDLSLRFQAADRLFLYADANYSHGRALDEEEGADRIPLAPEFTTTGGISYAEPQTKGIYGGLRYRLVGDRPANEDNSIVAEGYFVLDANLGYRFNQLSFQVIVENVLDTEWNETQFATESRLFNEPEPVEEIHFTPGLPFFARAAVSYRF